MSGPFDGLPVLAADMIMADPPWLFENYSVKGEEKNASAKYACMDLNDIKRLPVGTLAGPNCILWLWATNPMLPQAFEVMAAWGFRFITAGHWAKYNFKTKKQAFGPGYVLRCAGEPFLIGAVGEPKTSKSVRSVIMGPRREHSRKPDEAYREAEKLVSDARLRLDLFSRQKRDGWMNWGFEADKFDKQEAAE